MILCFVIFQESKDSPKYMQKSVVEWQVIEHEAQSESLKVFKCRMDDLDNIL